MNLINETANYPLKIIEMDHFLQNSDELLSSPSDMQENPQNRKCLTNDSKYTLLFIDSEKYRQHFEKTHLKLKNNIIVLDRHINFQSLDELYQFYNLFYNSKYWLLHGTLKCLAETESKELKRKSNQIIDKYCDNKNTEMLLVLNSDDSYVKPILENAFTKLINNFSNSTRSTFEINYENILKSYLMRKFQNEEPLFKLEESKSNLKLIRFNVIFTVSANKNQSELVDFYCQDKPLAKLGNIFSRLKNAISNKPKAKPSDVSNHQNVHTEFSLDLLPSLFYYFDDNELNFNCVSFNDDQYNRTQIIRGRERSSKKMILKDNINNQSLEISNRFQTYIIRSKSKFKNYDKINEFFESNSDFLKENQREENFHSSTETKLSSSDEAKKETESPVNSSMSSLSSSLSNYINNKKKRLTKSTSFNFAFENIDDEHLIDHKNEIEQTNSKDSVAVFACEDFNYDYKCKHETKSQDYTDSNRRNCVIDEKILRHPALVKQNLKSRSVDLFESQITNLENNLKQQTQTKTKYRKNSKLVNNTTQYQKQTNQDELSSQHNKRISTCSTTSNENKLKIATVNNYKIKKLTTQKPSNRQIVYSKSYKRQSRSPPPPISLSPTGLLAPPPPPLPSPNSVSQKLFSNSQHYLQPISRGNSELECSTRTTTYNRLIKNENELRASTNQNSNYNHLYLKKINDSEKRVNTYSNVKARFFIEQNESSLEVSSKLSALSGENNRFRNTEKVF